MHPLYSEYARILASEDKGKAIETAVSWLEQGKIGIVEFYGEILAPSLNEMEYPENDAATRVWREHVRSAIVRSVMENCHRFVLLEKIRRMGKRNHRKIIVACPAEEYHEIGARMAADFFTICGFDATFIGANTPAPDILAGIVATGPEAVCVSVSNYYHLSAAKKLIGAIKEQHPGLKVIAGGNALRRNPGALEQIGADLLLDSFSEIENFARGEG